MIDMQENKKNRIYSFEEVEKMVADMGIIFVHMKTYMKRKAILHLQEVKYAESQKVIENRQEMKNGSFIKYNN